MKEFLTNFNKAFENRVRLGIMSVLVVNDAVTFNTLKELLKATDGNLASHLKALEKLEFVKVNKQFIDRKPNTSYEATNTGKEAFQAHLNALEDLLKKGL
ncbi:MAG: transcriptional regulator [Cytophagales bacterium]|nr:transcriptional regulator [Cytophagales bacterium]